MSIAWGAACAAWLAAAVPASEVEESVQVIRQVGPDGKGSAAAARAWRVLARAEPAHLPAILAGMDGASPLARNWLRSAAGAAVASAAGRGEALPVAELDRFLRDRGHDPQARRLAYEFLRDADPQAPDRYLPGMLDDPSPALRREAVARATGEAQRLLDAGEKGEALARFRAAFAAARDQKQVVALARKLRGLGEPVELPRHLGLVLHWRLIGPFPYDGKGDPSYPPEETIDPAARYDGKAGKVGWRDYASGDELGIVDLNKGLAPGEDQIGYALAEFTSDADRAVEVRVGCFNKFKLWVNGELVLDRADAFTGMRLDHYRAAARLKKGTNRLLLKVYQAEVPSQLPKLWQFMLRVCDAEGVAVLSTTRPPEPKPEKGPKG